MKETFPSSQELPKVINPTQVGKTALELLAQPVEVVYAPGPPQTPPVDFPTSPHPTPPDHTGYPDVTPPDREHLFE
jgi:hypothetical protein